MNRIAAASLVEDEFLSRCLQQPTFNLILDSHINPDDIALIEWPDQGMVAVKIDASNLELTNRLISKGFYLSDTSITFSTTARMLSERLKNVDIASISLANPNDQQDIVDICQQELRYSRLVNDPFISRTDLDRVRQNWIGNYFKGERGDFLWVARVDDSIAGFLLTLRDRDYRTIDLVAVKSSHQRQGILKSLLVAWLRTCSPDDRLKVGTQAQNLAALRIYSQLGFEPMKITYSLHRHF